MDILDVLLGGVLGFILVSVLPNNWISWSLRGRSKSKKVRSRKI